MGTFKDILHKYLRDFLQKFDKLKLLRPLIIKCQLDTFHLLICIEQTIKVNKRRKQYFMKRWYTVLKKDFS